MLQFPYWATLDMEFNVFRNMDEPINLKAWGVQFHIHKTRPTCLIQALCFTDLKVNVLCSQEHLGTSESLPWTSSHSSLMWRYRKRWNIHTGVYEILYTPLIRKRKQSKVPTWMSWNHLGLLAMSAWEHETNFMTTFQGSGEALW